MKNAPLSRKDKTEGLGVFGFIFLFLSLLGMKDLNAQTGTQNVSKVAAKVLVEQPVAAVKPSLPDNAQATYLTIYKDAALVKQTRNLALQAGIQSYYLSAIAHTIQPESLMISAPVDVKGIEILEYNLADSQENADRGINLAATSKESVNAAPFQLLYLFKDLGWQIYYTLQFDTQYDRLVLNSWVQLTNKSGATFQKATIQLVDAVAPSFSSSEKGEQVFETETDSASFSYAYAYGRPIDIPLGGVKRISWAYSPQVQAKQDYRLFVGGKYLEDMEGKPAHPNIETWFSFINHQSQGLGQPLPAGNATLYWRDEKGNSEVLGRTFIPATASGQEVSIKIPATQANKVGRVASHAHVLQAIETELDQTEFKKLSDKIIEASYRLTLRNKSEQVINIRIALDLPPGEWTIVRENIAHQQVGDHQAYWTIQVGANSESDLKYRIRLIKV